jgi:hypothetical protein
MFKSPLAHSISSMNVQVTGLRRGVTGARTGPLVTGWSRNVDAGEFRDPVGATG